MTGNEFTVYGVYVTPSVYDALADRLYDRAGIVDLDDYFSEDMGTVPAGDPGAEATDEFLATVVDEFATLYDAAAFDAAATVDPDGFDLVQLAATPTHVTRAREQFQAAATIQETDLRTVQTATLAAALDVDLATADE